MTEQHVGQAVIVCSYPPSVKRQRVGPATQPSARSTTGDLKGRTLIGMLGARTDHEAVSAVRRALLNTRRQSVPREETSTEARLLSQPRLT